MLKTGKPLSCELGPGLCNNIFDGIQRPLKAIQEVSGTIYIPRGINTPALDKKVQWEFTPTAFKVNFGSAFREKRLRVSYGRSAIISQAVTSLVS